MVPLAYLFLLFCCTSAELSANFRSWESNADDQVDIYAPGTLAITWMNDEGDVHGFFHHLESYTSSPTLLFGRSVCKPYTVVKWHEGQQGIINGACAFNGVNWPNNASLMLQGQRLFLPITGNISQIKYDYFTKRLYAYSWPVLYAYSARTFARLNAFRLLNMRDFYVSNAHLFYATEEGQVNVYNERTNEHFKLEDAPGGHFKRYHIYDTAQVHVSSSAANHSMFPLATLSLLIMFMALY